MNHPIKDKEKLYREFRNELDEIWIKPFVKAYDKEIELIYSDNGSPIGFINVLDGSFIDALYIEPEYRRKGYGERTVRNWMISHSRVPDRLVIIKHNKVAYKFWSKIFMLAKIDGNETDNLYEILCVK